MDMAGTTLIDRALLRLSGEDVRGFLQGLVTNDLARWRPIAALGRAADRAGQGLFDFILWADGDDVLIDCEAEQADALGAALSSIACAGRSRSGATRAWRCIGRRTATARRSAPARARPPLARARRRARPRAGSRTAFARRDRRRRRAWPTRLSGSNAMRRS